MPPNRTVADAADVAVADDGCNGCCCCNDCCCGTELAVRAAARAELMESRDPVTTALGLLLLLLLLMLMLLLRPAFEPILLSDYWTWQDMT